MPGPDFPTAGIINGSAGIVEAYTHRPRPHPACARKAEIETDDNGRETIIVTEIPYQVNKARLIEKIAELVKEKKLEGISEACATSPTRTACASSSRCAATRRPTCVLNNLFQQTPAAGHVRHQHGRAGRRPAAHC